MSRIVFILIVCLSSIVFLNGQSVDMAEIKGDGIVVPVVDHNSVVNPDEGQLSFNPNTNSYWYFDGGQWFELSPNSINDTDSDTYVSVEQGSDEDEVLFVLEGKEYGRIIKNSNGIHVFSLFNDNTQRGNVVFGINSGLNLDTNGFCCNSLFGEEAGRELTSGDTNVMMGTGAGRNSTTASGNTFIGTDAGEANINGYGNVSIGKSSGFSNAGSSHNVMVGVEAGFTNIAADNTFIGGFSGKQTTNGDGNTFLGANSGENNTTGKNNVSLGRFAGQNISSGQLNTFIGFEAGRENGAGNSNTFVGVNSGKNSMSKVGNVFVGQATGINNAGDSNIAMGSNSGGSNTGSNNIFIGDLTGLGNTGDYNVIIGEEAGMNHKGGSSILIGWNAGMDNLADDLMAIGEDSGLKNEGMANTFVGKRTGAENTTGSNNTYFGFSAGQNNQLGDENVMVGDSAGYQSTGRLNSFIGSRAGISVTTGVQNTFLGRAAGENSTTGSFNTFLGEWSGRWNGTGTENTYVGKSSGLANFDGNANTFIGRGIGAFNQYTVDSSIVIGYFTGDGFMASNRLIIENSNDAQPLIYGEFDSQKLGVNWDSSMPVAQTLSVNGNASKSASGDWMANSDARLKSNITYLSSEKMLDKLRNMKAVSYTWNDQVTGYNRPEGTQYGFIAQDIQNVWPNNVSSDSQGYLETAYGTYDHMYVEAIKELANENERLKEELKTIEDKFNTEIEKLRSLIINDSVSN